MTKSTTLFLLSVAITLLANPDLSAMKAVDPDASVAPTVQSALIILSGPLFGGIESTVAKSRPILQVKHELSSRTRLHLPGSAEAF